MQQWSVHTMFRPPDLMVCGSGSVLRACMQICSVGASELTVVNTSSIWYQLVVQARLEDAAITLRHVSEIPNSPPPLTVTE